MTMTQPTSTATQFAVCVDNSGYPASLEVGKIYRVMPDEDAATHGYLRVVDESGEDYAYSARRFYPIEVPRRLEEILLSMGAAVATSGA